MVHTEGNYAVIEPEETEEDAALEEEEIPKPEPQRLRHGQGIFTFTRKGADGEERYEGEWKNDEMDGNGVYHFASGASYEGGFQSGQFQGEGVYRWADGKRYEGGWSRSRMHGEGVFEDVNNIRWKGSFVNGKFADVSGKFIDLVTEKKVPASLREVLA